MRLTFVENQINSLNLLKKILIEGHLTEQFIKAVLHPFFIATYLREKKGTF